MHAASRIYRIEVLVVKRQLFCDAYCTAQSLNNSRSLRQRKGATHLSKHGGNHPCLLGSRKQELDRMNSHTAELQNPLAPKRRNMGVSLNLSSTVVRSVRPKSTRLGKRSKIC